MRFIKWLNQCAIFTLIFTNYVLAQTQTVEQEALVETDFVSSADTQLPLDQIKTFSEVFTRIKRNYVTPVSDELLLEYAIKGMLHGLDPHSVYLKGESFEQLNEGTTGRFGGLGMEVIMEDGFVKVVAPIDDTPASKAGIQTGDLIIRIDGKAISGGSLREATEQMRGEPGTAITLTILRETDPDPFDLELQRALVQLSSVKSKMLSKAVGYIRISQFQLATSDEFRKQLKALRNNEAFGGLVLDLRNNPGGLLTSAVSIADNFIAHGAIVSTKGRHTEDDQAFTASPSDLIDGKPVVVLINGGSASASEIVAGALQDHGRGLILGTESFGKGSVQSVVNIGETEAIKMTTARYYTPSGRSIQAAGIVPDVIVESRQFKEQKKRYQRIKENDLMGHLSNDTNPEVEKTSKGIEAQLKTDYQLNEAFNLLNGLVLFKTSSINSTEKVAAELDTNQ